MCQASDTSVVLHDSPSQLRCQGRRSHIAPQRRGTVFFKRQSPCSPHSVQLLDLGPEQEGSLLVLLIEPRER